VRAHESERARDALEVEHLTPARRTGQLALFDSVSNDDEGRCYPGTIAKAITPSRNSIAFFAVGDKSFHEVRSRASAIDGQVWRCSSRVGCVLERSPNLTPTANASNPIQSNPIQSNPIQSNPIQSNPILNPCCRH